MTWKSYAAVSGATVLAGWLASTPPSSVPGGAITASSRPEARRSAAASSDIVHEAERLQVRVRREVQFADPQRDPFRFGEDTPAPDSRGGDPAASVTPAVEIPFVAPPPPVTLAGIAEDQKGEVIERTAILSSPAGVLLVREGENVLGDYRVGRIEAESIELVKTDGTTLRLTLSRP